MSKIYWWLHIHISGGFFIFMSIKKSGIFYFIEYVIQCPKQCLQISESFSYFCSYNRLPFYYKSLKSFQSGSRLLCKKNIYLKNLAKCSAACMAILTLSNLHPAFWWIYLLTIILMEYHRSHPTKIIFILILFLLSSF